MLYMKFSLFNIIFNKKLIKGFPPCTDCPDSNSDCGKPCGCGEGGAGGCGSGGAGAGGAGGGGAGGGAGPSPRSGGSGGWGGPGGEIEQVSIEIFDDPNFAENVSSEVEEFLAVGQVPYVNGVPAADGAGFPMGSNGACVTIPRSQMFGGGGCQDGCGPACGGGDGFSAGFGGGNPYINIQNGNFNFNTSLFGQGNGNNMVGVTINF